MTPYTAKKLLPFGLLALLAMLLIGCASDSGTASTETPAAETRELRVTVVVTATPVPTPTYASKINAASGTLVYP